MLDKIPADQYHLAAMSRCMGANFNSNVAFSRKENPFAQWEGRNLLPEDSQFLRDLSLNKKRLQANFSAGR